MSRVGIIVCQRHWLRGCPGLGSHVLCFQAVAEKKGPLGHLPDPKIQAYCPCGQCSRAGLYHTTLRLARQENLQAMVFPTCLFQGTPCPHAAQVAEEVEKILGVQVVLGSYYTPQEAARRPPAASSLVDGPPGLASYLQVFNWRYYRPPEAQLTSRPTR